MGSNTAYANKPVANNPPIFSFSALLADVNGVTAFNWNLSLPHNRFDIGKCKMYFTNEAGDPDRRRATANFRFGTTIQH